MTQDDQEFQDWYDQLCFLQRDYSEGDPDYHEAHRLWLLGYSPEDADNEIRAEDDMDPFEDY